MDLKEKAKNLRKQIKSFGMNIPDEEFNEALIESALRDVAKRCWEIHENSAWCDEAQKKIWKEFGL